MSHSENPNSIQPEERQNKPDRQKINNQRLQEIAAEQWRDIASKTQPKIEVDKHLNYFFSQLMAGTVRGIIDPAPEMREVIGNFGHAPRKEALKLSRQLSGAEDYLMNTTLKQMGKDLKKEVITSEKQMSHELKEQPQPYEVGRFLGESIDYAILSEVIAACKIIIAAKRAGK